MIVIILIAALTYIGMIFFTKRRTPISILGSAILLIYGSLSNFFSAQDAFDKFPKEIVLLIITLALYSKTFEESGLFSYVGNKFIKLSKGKRILIIMMLPIVIYVASLFMNNLSVILLFTFIASKLILHFKLPVIPILVSTIIASNIGGAALPWADTPAVILTLYTDFNLLDFLAKLFIPCAIIIVLLAIYLMIWYKCKKSEITDIKENIELNLDYKQLKLPIILFTLFIISVCIAPFIGLSIAYISLFFGGIILFVNRNISDNILNSLPILDPLIFIISLFLIGGALEYSGILNKVAEYILSFTGSNEYLILLSIMLTAFVIATFLSAGPAAATLLPICNQLSSDVGHNLIYVAFALGILAGSSMLPWSATGGPIMFSEVNRFLKQHNTEKSEVLKEIYNIKKYIAFSIPFSLMILLISSLCLYCLKIIFT